MKTSRRCKSTVLRPVGLLCLGLLILNVTLWSTLTTLVYASTHASCSASAGWRVASGQVNVTFTGNAELFPIDTIWKGSGRAEAGLGPWYRPSKPGNIDSGEIFVKIKEKTRYYGVPPFVVAVPYNYAHTQGRSKSAYGSFREKFSNSSGNWQGSTLSGAWDSWP